MRRLLERQQAGELATRHVRAVAETVGWVDQHVGHGNCRTWAKLPSHLTAETYGKSRAGVDRQILERACARLLGPL
ncbi:hypothetical protein [Streptomyces capillispiralis]|uniref:Uncharacterized protein n=1 Tax=Streptomyces capillispiralis TaxID=68182 RepID=A0A561TS52_9ACTN|nr:hypothetical protein [Streptomyces capillispiralis]TWF89932.1 hypothetical protein FHX78_116981 [Streptomyces capillispiralis]